MPLGKRSGGSSKAEISPVRFLARRAFPFMAEIYNKVMFHRSRILAAYLVLYLGSVFYFTSPQAPRIDFLVLAVCFSALIILYRIKVLRYLLLAVFVVIFSGWQIGKITAFTTLDSTTGITADEFKQSGYNRRVVVTTATGTKVLVNYDNYFEPKIGEPVKFSGDIIAAAEDEYYQENPGYFLIKGIDYVAKDAVLEPEVSGGTKYGTSSSRLYYYIRGILVKWRKSLEGRLLGVLPPSVAGLAIGILLGNKDYISNIQYSAFVAIGLVHIMALSGYNITIIADNIEKVAKNISFRIAGWASLVSIWLFVLATGLSASVVRAAIMTTVLLLAKRFGRQSDSLVAVLLTAAIMVGLNPYILRYDIGFQLSFAALTGIILLGPSLKRSFQQLGRNFSEIISATIGAQLFTMPILSFYFGQVSPISLIANILVLPFIPTIMLVSFTVGLISFLSEWLAVRLGYVLWLLLGYVTQIVQSLSAISLPGQNLKMSPMVLVGSYLLIMEIIMIARHRYQHEKN